jgi:hypothetical protein
MPVTLELIASAEPIVDLTEDMSRSSNSENLKWHYCALLAAISLPNAGSGLASRPIAAEVFSVDRY